ncbi:MAG: hypothetical protein IPH62_00795 [Ignavibacteriae bacterium]|nr:hypothetical protein [Ignavibacteriota bacterium]
MKKLIILILLFFGFITINAQDSCNVEKNNLRHGIQFQIRSLSLTNFNSYTLAYRYLLSEKSGLRLGILTIIRDQDIDADQNLQNNIYNSAETTKDYDMKLSIQYLQSILNFEKFSLIIGGGTFIGYTKDEYSYEYPEIGLTRIRKSSEKGLNYGIELLMGVEYKLYKNVFLSGEYGLALTLGNLDIKTIENTIFDDPSSNYINEKTGQKNIKYLSGVGVNLGLSIFF